MKGRVIGWLWCDAKDLEESDSGLFLNNVSAIM